MTSLHLSVSELVEGGLAKLTANLVAVLAYVIAAVLLDWALLWTEASIEVRYEFAVIAYGMAALVIWSLLRLTLGGKLRSLLRDPEELATRIVFAGIAWVIALVCVSVGLMILIFPGLYLSARWFIAAELILLDGTGILEGLGRSWSLTEPSAWPLMGVSLILMIPPALLAFSGFGLDNATGFPQPGLVAGWVVSSCVGAFGAAVAVFAWYRLSGQTGELEQTFA